MNPAVRIASRALALRAWALDVLHGAVAGDAPAAHAPDWTVFLETERCALPLLERVRGGVTLEGAPREALERMATAELKRVLAARAQLRLLDRMAGRLDATVVVLKGGVAVGDALPLDVMDVDLLVRDEDLAAFAAAADEQGYARIGEDRVGPLSEAHHLANRLLPSSIPVEFHHRVPGVGEEAGLRSRSVPLDALPHSFRLAPADHLWHLLVHGAVHHPLRRGRIRDLLLTARAVGGCAEEELAGVRVRLAEHPFAVELARVLAMSEALLAGRPTADPFRTTAAANYLLTALPLRGGAIPGDLASCVSILVGGGADRRQMGARLWHNPRAPSEVGSISALERRLPRLGAGVRRAARVLRYASVLPRAAIVAEWARRAARTSPATKGSAD